jgi:hypothetical protein
MFLKVAANSSLQQPVGGAAVLWLQSCYWLMLLRRVPAAGIWAFEKVDCRWYMIHTASTVPCLSPHLFFNKAKIYASYGKAVICMVSALFTSVQPHFRTCWDKCSGALVEHYVLQSIRKVIHINANTPCTRRPRELGVYFMVCVVAEWC